MVTSIAEKHDRSDGCLMGHTILPVAGLRGWGSAFAANFSLAEIKLINIIEEKLFEIKSPKYKNKRNS